MTNNERLDKNSHKTPLPHHSESHQTFDEQPTFSSNHGNQCAISIAADAKKVITLTRDRKNLHLSLHTGEEKSFPSMRINVTSLIVSNYHIRREFTSTRDANNA
jgi:hypothetical protein